MDECERNETNASALARCPRPFRRRGAERKSGHAPRTNWGAQNACGGGLPLNREWEREREPRLLILPRQTKIKQILGAFLRRCTGGPDRGESAAHGGEGSILGSSGSGDGY